MKLSKSYFSGAKTYEKRMSTSCPLADIDYKKVMKIALAKYKAKMRAAALKQKKVTKAKKVVTKKAVVATKVKTAISKSKTNKK